MKNVHDVAIYSVLGVVFLLTFRAQSETKGNTYIQESTAPGIESFSRTITVTGTADMLVPPDTISVDIVFREYWRIGAVDRKVNIDSIEKKIINAATEASIPSKNISIDSYGAWRYNWNYWQYWQGNKKLLAQRKLTLSLNTVSELNEIINSIKSASVRKEGIVSIMLRASTHTKIQEYRKLVKERAMQAAREKASYLLDSVHETRGALITATELKDPQNKNIRQYGYWGNPYGWAGLNQTRSLAISNSSVNVPYDPTSPTSTDDLSMKPIRLQYAIEATFEIDSSD